MTDASLRPARRLAPALLVGSLLAALAACGGKGDGGSGTVVGPNPGTGTGTTGSTPVAIPVLGQGAITARYTGEVSVRGTVAYTSTWGRRRTAGNAIYVWNVAVDTPQLVDSLLIDGVTTTGDVQVSDDGALLVVATEPSNAGSLVIYSLADPLHPRLITRYTSPNLDPGVHTAQVSRVGGTQYVFASVDPRTGTPAKLVVLDLTNPAAPREVLVRTMGAPFVHDVFVRDGILMTANWNEGLVIWDIGGGGKGGTPATPVQLGSVVTAATDPRSGASVHNVWWLNVGGSKRYALVGEELTTGSTIGNSSAGDVHVVDVSDLTRPREVAFYRVPNAGTHNFVVDEARGIAYAAYYNGGVRAIDVRGDLATCTAAQQAADGRCDLTKMGRELGVALNGTPTTRDPISGLTYPPFVWGVDLAGDALYASDMMGGLFKLRALSR